MRYLAGSPHAPERWSDSAASPNQQIEDLVVAVERMVYRS